MAIVINPQVRMTGALGSIRKLDQSLQDIKKQVQSLNKLLEKTAKLAENAGASLSSMRPASSGSGSSRGGGASQKPYYFKQYGSPVGPSPNAPFFKQYSSPIGPMPAKPQKSFFDKAQDTLMRSRVGKSGLMPLVGDIIRMLPPEFRGVAQAALAAIAVAKEALEVQEQYMRLYVTGGGSPAQAASVGRINSALGTDVSGIGRNLSTGYGPMVAGMAGVNPLGGPFGDMDYNKKTLRVLELIARQTSFTGARRVAEMSGVPEAAQFALMSKITQNQLLNRGGQPENAIGMKTLADLKGQLSIAMGDFLQSVMTIITPAMQLADTFLKAWNGLHLLEMALGPVITGMKFFAAVLDKLSGFFDWLARLFGKHDEHKDSLDRNTQSLDQLNKSINQGVFGGGPRAQGAIPKAQQRPGYYQNNPYTGMGVL